MAKINLKAGVKQIKDQAFEINDLTIATADEAVELAVKNGKEWQRLFGKTVKSGSKLFWKQQDLAISALENVTDQVVESNQKLVEFLELDNVVSVFKSIRKKGEEVLTGDKVAKVKTAYPTKTVLKKVKSTKKAAKKAAKKASKKASKTVEMATTKVNTTVEAPKVIKTVKKVAGKVTTKVAAPTKATKKATKKSTKAVKKTTKKVATPKIKVAKATKATKAVKKTTKKVAAPKKATKVERTVVRTIVKEGKDNLRLIQGIGAKTEILLNKQGISSFEQLANASSEKLQSILEMAGPRFTNFDAKIWTKEAKLGMNGKLK